MLPPEAEKYPCSRHDYLEALAGQSFAEGLLLLAGAQSNDCLWAGLLSMRALGYPAHLP